MTKALQPDDLIAHYRVIRALGAGGMGEVYLARDSTLDRDIALKVLPQMAQDDERVRRFVLEAKSASSLSHPHIITVYEIGCEPVISGGRPRAEKVNYIAMELVDGAALADIIHDNQHRTDLKTLLGYLAQAADGLAKAHASGIVHRDLKPGNIMVSKDGYAKVLDFGLAKLVEKEPAAADATIDAATRQALTVEGMIVGTVGYMAPEQILGRPVDHRSDIFSFGCILYEAITRQRPFTADSQFEALQKIIHEHPAPMESVIADVPVDLRTLVGRCLAKGPDERVQSMKDVSSDLRRISGSYEVLARSAASATDRTVFFPGASGAVPPPSGQIAPSGAAWSTPSGVAAPSGIAPVGVKKKPLALMAAAAVVILAIGGFAVYKFGLGGASSGLSEEALSQMKISAVLSNEVLQGIAVSPEGKYAGHVSLLNGKYQLQIRQISTGKDIDIVKAQDLAITGLAFSPDGDHMWFCMVDKENQQYSSLYEVPSLGGDPKRKVSDSDTEPTFSPDGKSIAFVRGSPNDRKAALIIAQEDGSSQKVVANLPAEIDYALVKPRWSPDGRMIAVIYFAAPGKPNLLVFDAAEAGKQQQIGNWEGRVMDSVAWMGTTGLVVAGAPAPGPAQLWYVAYPGGQRRRLSNDISDYAFVSTSADGKTIAARRNQRASEIWQVPLDGVPGDMKQVTTGKENVSSLVAASDGSLIFNAPQEDSMTLWSLKPGGSKTSIAPKGATVLSHRFIRGQEATAFTAYGADFIGHIYRVNVDGSNPKQLTKGSGETIVGVTADGKYVLFTTPQAPRTLMVLPSDGSGQPRQLATDYIDGLLLSRDGKLASFNHLDPSKKQTESVRTVVNFEDGKTIATLPLRGGYQFTPDGTAMTYIQPLQPASDKAPLVPATAFRVPLAGGPPQKLFDVADSRIDVVRWADEKTAIVAAFSLKTSVSNLWRWSAGSPKLAALTDFRSGFVFEFAVSQDGKTIYFIQGSNNRDIIKITGLIK